MKIIERRIVVAVMSFQIVSAALLLVLTLFGRTNVPDRTFTVVGITIALGVFLTLLIAYLLGWDWARLVNVFVATLSVALTLQEPYISLHESLLMIVPPVIASLTAGAGWGVVSTGLLLGIVLPRAQWQGVYTDPATMTIYGGIVAAVLVSRWMTDHARRIAEQERQQTNDERARTAVALVQTEQQTQQLAVQKEQLVATEAALRALVGELETPAVAVADGVLLAPIVGRVDVQRAALLTQRLLGEVYDRRARLMIIDIAGASAVDDAVIGALVSTAHAVQLLGCRVVITGISAGLAATLARGDYALGGIATARSPQDVLALEMQMSQP